MFKKLALATTALAGLSGAALAADLPARTPAPAPFVAVPVFTWTGFYIGANAGYIFNDDTRVQTVGNGPVTAGNVASGARPGGPFSFSPEGFTGGGQIGYNYQFGPVVVGVEADAAYTDYAQTIGVTGNTGAFSTYRTDLGYLGTVRGRIGYAFDRVLVYGTGGFAYGDVRNTAVFFAPVAAGGTGVVQFAGQRSSTETGFAAGGGVEYAFPTGFSLFGSNAVTVKAEALYYDLGSRTVLVNRTAAAPAAATSYNSRFDMNGVVARAGINFKFGTF